MEAEKLEFGVVVRRSDNGSDERQSFVTMRYKRSGTYQPHIRKLKRYDIVSKKCEYPVKLHKYCMEDEIWKFNVIFGIHNHVLTDKLVDHSIVCQLTPEEKKLVSVMTLNMMTPKNILTPFEIEKTSKYFKYQANIQCACSKQQGRKRTKI